MEHHEIDKKKWLPKKGYHKICPIDAKEFYGRKNQIYCSSQCKQKVASEILSGKNQEYGTLFRSYIKNAEILCNNYPGKNNLSPISRNKLYNEGFNPGGLIQLRKLNDLPGIWNIIGDFAFQQDPQNANNIFILKL